MEEFYSISKNETMEIAKNFAKTLKVGDIVLIDGDLGAGKTVFSKGIVAYFSNDEIIATSPTFVIVNAYNTTPPIYHFDLYRITDESELYAIGAEEYFFGDGISLVEWPLRAEGFFPASSIKIFIEKINDNERKIIIRR